MVTRLTRLFYTKDTQCSADIFIISGTGVQGEIQGLILA
jgi:hypothetical protein